MNLNDWIRKVHRWLSVAFTAAAALNLLALARQAQALWIGLLALVPLVLLLATGLYLFVLPHALRRGRRGEARAT